MIVQCQSGAQIVIGECPWVPGVYLSVGNQRGSQGVVLTPAELDQVRTEFDRIAALLAERAANNQQRKVA